jgi:NitT/TauT family transport system substrate-binding protein
VHIIQSRRHFLSTLSAAGAAGFIDARSSLAAEGPPETTTIRLRKSKVICFAPLYLLETLLRGEGFTDIQYPAVEVGQSVRWVERGDLDFDVHFAGAVVYSLASGSQIMALGGLHAGCYELFAREPIRTLSDLKERRVGIDALNSGNHVYLSIMAAYVGLDPKRDIEWVTSTAGSSALDLFAAGQADAFLGFPPEPQELRSRGIDRVILNTITDAPWSQYFCCMIYGNQAWVRDHPVATKRFLRAILKAADLCSAEPETAARRLVDGGFAERYDWALETIETVPYQRWREYDSEDTFRFYALRLHEGGMISKSPNALIAEGTDWSFLNELKRELKA